MKSLNFLCLVVLFWGSISISKAQESEFSISGDCYNSILGGVAFDGENFLAGMTGDSESDSSVTVQFISPAGQLSGDRIALGETGSAPVVAYDGTNYLVIWAKRYVGFLDNGEDAGVTDIYGRFINPSGEFAGEKFTVVSDAYIKGAVPGAVHFNGSDYFFIYKEDDGNNDEGHEYGIFISKEGEVSENPVQITTTDVQDIALAFDGTNYLTVFNVDSKFIYGQFVSTEGTLIGASFLIDNSENYSDDPLSVTFGGNKFLVAFPDDSNPGLNDDPEWNIFGRFVSKNGEVDAEKITICEFSQNPILPTLAFDGSNYLTAWISMNEQTISGRYLKSNGEPANDEFVIYGNTSGTMPLGGVMLFSDDRFLAVCTRVNWEENNDNEKSARANINNGIYGKFVNRVTAVFDRTDEKGLFKIYPNPASDQITLSVSEIHNATFTIYKETGEVTASGTINARNQQIPVGNLSGGIYFLEIKTSNGSEKQKLLINR